MSKTELIHGGLNELNGKEQQQQQEIHGRPVELNDEEQEGRARRRRCWSGLNELNDSEGRRPSREASTPIPLPND